MFYPSSLAGGELDILEYANDESNKVTFHTNRACKLNVQKLRKCARKIKGIDPWRREIAVVLLFWMFSEIQLDPQKKMGLVCHGGPQKSKEHLDVHDFVLKNETHGDLGIPLRNLLKWEIYLDGMFIAQKTQRSKDPKMIVNCYTNYSSNQLGCMPPQVRKDGEWYAKNPGAKWVTKIIQDHWGFFVDESFYGLVYWGLN